MTDLFYRNRRLTALSIGLILVSGLAALQSLPRQEDPTLTRRFGMITTVYPGASPLRVESMVTEKIEQELLQLHEIKTVESTSRTAISILAVELQDQYTEADVDEIWSKVRDRLADAAVLLPPGALQPELEERTTVAATVLTGLVWEGPPPVQMDLVTRLAEELEQRLRNLPDTRETEIYGGAIEEIRVTVDADVLASVGLTPLDVSRAVARADAKVPADQLRTGATDLLIEVAGALDSVERIRSIPLIERRDGGVVRVGDVATVEKTIQEPTPTVAIVSGQDGVVVSATMEPYRRVDTWAVMAREAIEAFERELPSGVRLELLFDQSVYTDERLSSLALNLLLGAGMVLLVLFFMMGVRSALIVGLALPFTLALVLLELKLLGVPLHQTSVTGLIIALGLLIDNAIVVVDEYRAELRGGAQPGQAVSRAVGHLRVPLFASTLTTVLSFLPIVLMPGGGGEFVGPIAVGVALSVTTSFVLAMTIVPALAGYTIRHESTGERRWWRDGISYERLTAIYRRSLDIVLRRPFVGIGVSLVLPLLGFMVAGTLTEQFFPPNDRNQFQLQLTLPSQSSVAETRARAFEVRALLHAHEEVQGSQWFVGEAPPRVFYNMMGNQDGVSSFAGAFVTTTSAEATERLLPRLQVELARAFPDAMVVALPFEQGPPFDAPIEVRLIGPELAVLRDLGEQLRAILTETDEATYTRAGLSGGRPKLMLEVDEDQARLAGLQLVDIAQQLDADLEGAVGGSVLEATEEIPVRVRQAASVRGDLSRIATHGIVVPGLAAREEGGSTIPVVPLSALSRVSLVPEVASISRYNGERSNTVQAFLTPYALIAESLADFQRRLDESEFALPAGYRMELGGESEQRSEAIGNLLVFAFPLLIVMAGTIILSFNSFRFAGVIFAVAIPSIGLAMLGVWMFGYPLGFLAVVGAMGLVGLAINGGIVVLAALRANEAAMQGDPEAAREVVVGATRHIVATTLTTIGGFLPLILFGGRFWPPMATAIAGGVGGSAILALYLVPSLFALIVRQRVRAAARQGSGRPVRRARPLDAVAASTTAAPPP